MLEDGPASNFLQGHPLANRLEIVSAPLTYIPPSSDPMFLCDSGYRRRRGTSVSSRTSRCSRRFEGRQYPNIGHEVWHCSNDL